MHGGMKNSYLQKLCRYGMMRYYEEDEFVGRSLHHYGEYSEAEVSALRKILRPGDTCLDIGANIGALTVPMAQMVGETGRVIAFEACYENAELLRLNTAQYPQVDVREEAASDVSGWTRIKPLRSLGHKNYGRVEVGGSGERIVGTLPIDKLGLSKLKLAKIDVEGHELEVLRGMRDTITRLRPILYIENDREEKSEELVAWLVDHGYRPFWHYPQMFNRDNFGGDKNNIFGGIVSLMMLCIHEDSGIEVRQLTEVADIRRDDRMFDREIERYKRYVERDHTDMTARLMVAHYSNLMQREADAFAAIEENLRADPDHVATHAVRGLLRIQRGDWSAWKEYELRMSQQHKGYFGGDRDFHGAPKWDGAPTDKVVLVSAEQGFGDQIMFARFFKYVLERAPNAYLEVNASLFELFEQSSVAPPGRLLRMWRTLPKFDLQISSPSLPAALDAREDMIRINGPYLRADAGLIARWQQGNPSSARIGLCWQGSPRSERPFTRDIPLEIIEPTMIKHGPVVPLSQTGQFDSFADTAAAIAGLDLVITVDTSIAHLAGALGVPTWLLLSYDPDWRWGLKDESTIWYPSLRIFRQPRFRDWASVVAKIDAALEERET